MEFFSIAAGVSVHIWDYKSREGCKTLVLLHGYLETMYIWSDFAESLKEDYHIILIDLPGHGLTSSSPDGVNSMEFIADVVKDVLAKCNVEKACIGGHSLGGFAAEVCVDKYPELFEKMILFNSYPYSEGEEKALDRKREIALIELGKLESIAALSIPRMYAECNLRRVDDKVMETVELCETHDPAGIVASIKGMQCRPDMQELLKEAPIPILVITGDCDSMIPQTIVDDMRKSFPKVRVVTLPNTGHNSFIEAPQECEQLVKEFLG